MNVTADYELNVTASFHKVNRNRLRRIELQSTLTNANPALTASVFDNYFVQHPIPRSDLQYAWITGSLQTTVQPVLGYFPQDGLVSTGTGLISAVNFLSASELGSASPTAKPNTRQPKLRTSSGLVANSFVPTDFAGINSNIVEPISGSSFTLGYPLSLAPINYYNIGSFGSFPGYRS